MVTYEFKINRLAIITFVNLLIIMFVIMMDHNVKEVYDNLLLLYDVVI
jgi:hypothetical protein